MSNVNPVVVKSQKQVASLLEKAARKRAVAATNCNERSSRSHSVFRLHISGHNTVTEEKCRGGWCGVCLVVRCVLGGVVCACKVCWSVVCACKVCEVIT